jgi:hypothetical protein
VTRVTQVLLNQKNSTSISAGRATIYYSLAPPPRS